MSVVIFPMWKVAALY